MNNHTLLIELIANDVSLDHKLSQLSRTVNKHVRQHTDAGCRNGRHRSAQGGNCKFLADGVVYWEDVDGILMGLQWVSGTTSDDIEEYVNLGYWFGICAFDENGEYGESAFIEQ